MAWVGVGAAAWKQLETGQVDALNLYYSEDLKMSLSGIRIRQIAYPDHLRALFGSAMLAHVDMIRENPKLVGAMGRAMAKGAVACAAARETCARALIHHTHHTQMFPPSLRVRAAPDAPCARAAALGAGSIISDAVAGQIGFVYSGSDDVVHADFVNPSAGYSVVRRWVCACVCVSSSVSVCACRRVYAAPSCA